MVLLFGLLCLEVETHIQHIYLYLVMHFMSCLHCSQLYTFGICEARNQAKNLFLKTRIQRILQLIILMPLFVWYCMTSFSLLHFRPPKGSSPLLLSVPCHPQHTWLLKQGRLCQSTRQRVPHSATCNCQYCIPCLGDGMTNQPFQHLFTLRGLRCSQWSITNTQVSGMGEQKSCIFPAFRGALN